MSGNRPTEHRSGGDDAAAAKAGTDSGRRHSEFALKDAALGLARGFCIGAADVVPGVSGGTMAFILGIYRRLIEAIRAFDAALVRLLLAGRFRHASAHADLALIVPLGLGIFAALMFFTRVVPLPRLIATHPELVYGLFFGLIVASVVVLFRSLDGVRTTEWAAVFAGAAVGFGVVNLVPVSTPDASWFVALSGALAISAMLMPGLSGAFVLLILGKYAYVLDGIGRLDPGVLVPFGVGVVAGLIAFSRLLAWLLRARYSCDAARDLRPADRVAVGGVAVPGASLRDRARRAPPGVERTGLAAHRRRRHARRVRADGGRHRARRHHPEPRPAARRTAARLTRSPPVPELPEVESTRRDLARAVAGRVGRRGRRPRPAPALAGARGPSAQARRTDDLRCPAPCEVPADRSRKRDRARPPRDVGKPAPAPRSRDAGAS